MQQLDHLSSQNMSAAYHVFRRKPLTLVLPDDCIHLLHARLQLAAHPISDCINIMEHLALLFQFAAHVVCLHAQVAYRAKDAIQSFVLVVHNLHLLLLLELCVVVFIFLEGVWVRQHAALLLRILDCLLQRLVHVLDLVTNVLDQSSAALHFVDLESKLVGVMFHGFDAFDQVFQVLTEVLEGLLEFATCFSQLWTGC